MKSYSVRRNLFGRLANNSSAANLTLADQLMNDADRRICNGREWPFLEDEVTISTIANQQFYNLPFDYERLINVYITVGTTQYQPKEAPSKVFWDMLNTSTQVTSNIPDYFYVYNGQVGFYPTPVNSTTITYEAATGAFTAGLFITGATSGARASIISDDNTGTTGTLTIQLVSGEFVAGELITDTGTGSATTSSIMSQFITLSYKKRVIDLSMPDYTTGTIASVTNGSPIVSGTGTSWTAPMAGRWIRITPTDVASTSGDGLWYQILAVNSGTSLTLTSPYGGMSLPSVAGAAYNIGQMSLIPEPYQDISTYEGLEVYFTSIQPEPAKAQLYKMKKDTLLKQMERDEIFKTTDVVIMNDRSPILNPNFSVWYGN